MINSYNYIFPLMVLLLGQLFALHSSPSLEARSPKAGAASLTRLERNSQKMKLGAHEDMEMKELIQEQSKGGIVHEKSIKKQLAQIEKRMGSRPPMCNNKCDACNPCEAVQMPTPLLSKPGPRRKRMNAKTYPFLHVDYSNYEPEGWKCKCGSLIYNP